MHIAIQELAKKLKATRKNKGVSQREFAKTIGMPQSRLSRIENGITDIQISSLLELAISLDLELMLIPRQIVPIVSNLIRELTGPEEKPTETFLYDLGEEKTDES